ncbi:hypothetical protein EGW08_006862 [Elysia chlorotica]|uniref:Uncharacterized protein n=1 Tax=Elysia chlorotica TaxID=188477 RepID=A0A3S1BJN7_ELYCH|nr:hypothetical protein EGW08_006862 [Elysia chlorotica]
MNQLRAWLYGHDSNLTSRFKDNDNSNGTDRLTVTQQLSNEESSGGSDVTEKGLKKAILKIIPLTPGDCLECKLVGSGVMMMSGIIVVTSALKASTRSMTHQKVPLNGPRKSLYYAICGGLFVAFETAAVCRLFDLGPFTKPAGQNSLR